MSFRVCIVIVNWNSWQLLEQCLQALTRQTCQDFRVIVVDNASTQPMPAHFLQLHPRMQLKCSATNRGFAAANNWAIKEAHDADWIVLLNPDVFAEPDWLATLLAAARQNTAYAAFGSRQLMAGNESLLDGDGDVYHISGLVWRHGYGKPVEAASNALREVFAPCAAAALYRRDVLLALGGFDEDFFCYVEDVDLGFRLRLLGYRSLMVPGAVVRHVGAATSGGGQSDFAVYHGHRNLVWCFVKNMPTPLFWLLLPLHLAMNLVMVGVFVSRGRGRQILRAKRDALLGLPGMWRKRKASRGTLIAASSQIWRMLTKSIR